MPRLFPVRMIWLSNQKLTVRQLVTSARRHVGAARVSKGAQAPALDLMAMDMNRRKLLIGIMLAGLWPAHFAYAKDDDNSGSDKEYERDDDDSDEGRDDDDQGKASSAVENGDISPLSAIIKAALAHTPGQVLDVKLRKKDSSYLYRIKILTRSGRKRELFIDAQTRKVVKVKS
jgi:uncharacterized membrane protein YkoI